MKPILLIAMLLILASSTVIAQRKPRHCDVPDPRLEDCKSAAKKTHTCRKVLDRDLDCRIAKILAEPVHHPTADEWLTAYRGLTYWWEAYDYPFYSCASSYYGSCGMRRN